MINKKWLVFSWICIQYCKEVGYIFGKRLLSEGLTDAEAFT